ncbi:hypothetical protein GOBAR_AA00407 [Gossypium barbadense]|uniref:Uncharacterized protein n=1 Tax=Gossypium barbadense TaxID=3634 RepID=A0A2P5YX37_GOSBA|nr:hypothetical protein GOBAR_AA00407 [Gossypium barbadense]
MGRSPCCAEDANLKKGPWTPEEDQKLVDCINKHGHGSWRALPKLAGLNRCGKSCRLRWTNYLRPDIERGKFTEEEERVIINLHAVLGNKFYAASLMFTDYIMEVSFVANENASWQAFRMKKKHAEEERIKNARGREKTSDDIFVCERVCTSKRMLKKVGAFSKDPIPDTCVTVCGVSELDACSDACARTVCVNQHQFPFFLEHWLLITVTAISVSKHGSLNGGGSSLEAGRGDSPRDDLDRNTKKVRFKENNGNGDIDMVVE